MGIDSSMDVEKKETGISLVSVFGVQELAKPILKPYGLAERNGVLYVADVAAARILVIDIPKGSFDYLSGAQGLGKLKKPVSVAVDPEGFVYVADSDRREVVVFGPDGSFQNSYGRDMDMKPVALAVDGDSLYVLDLTKQQVLVLNRRTGASIGAFGRDEGPGKTLHIPTNMGLDDKGFLYLTNVGHGKTMVFDRDGHYVRSFGELGKIPGMFTRPRGITVDREGQVYVVDAGHQNVQIFNPDGRLLMVLSGINEPLGALNLPAGVLVSEANLEYFQKFAEPTFKLERLLYVTSQYSGKAKLISVFGMGKDTRLDYDKEYENLQAERLKRAEEYRKSQEKAKAEKEKLDNEKREQELKGKPSGKEQPPAR
jgi:DNA-binding beta-propeller fold protein YncE